jgi:hypothetical protein
MVGMIGWSQIIYGAALSAVLSGLVLLAVARPRQLTVILAGAAGAAGGPIAWNAILHTTHARQFFTDAPIAILPASWQDTGSGVFTLALTALLLGAGPLATASTRRSIALALTCALTAFGVDVYLY